MHTKLTALLLALITAVALTACGNDDHDGHDDSGSTIAEGEDFNQADVDFATEMIQHHAQALSMVDLMAGKKVSAELTTLSEEIRMAQGPEIETMVGWLDEWSQPIPETTRDHVNAPDGHGDDHGGANGGANGGASKGASHGGMDSEMPGMMSADDMKELGAAEGAEFERMWLEMMIEHHEGAVEMGETQVDDGEFPAAIDLAKTIISAQKSEIDTMMTMLDS